MRETHGWEYLAGEKEWSQRRPEPLVLYEQPRITVETRGGGVVALHFVLRINGVYAHDDGGGGTQRMFPDHPELDTWIGGVVEWSNEGYPSNYGGGL